MLVHKPLAASVVMGTFPFFLTVVISVLCLQVHWPLGFRFCCVVKSAQWLFHPLYCFRSRPVHIFLCTHIDSASPLSFPFCLSVSQSIYTKPFIYYKSVSLWRWFFLTSSPLGHDSHFSFLFHGWWLLMVQWPLWVMPVHFWTMLILFKMCLNLWGFVLHWMMVRFTHF